MATQKNASSKPESGDYPVGYGKPPKHRRFKPGKSGNPQGRPKGTKNLKTDLMEELGERILVREGDQARHVSKQRAMVKTLVASSLKGNTRAASLLLSMMMRLLDIDDAVDRDHRFAGRSVGDLQVADLEQGHRALLPSTA